MTLPTPTSKEESQAQKNQQDQNAILLEKIVKVVQPLVKEATKPSK